MKKLNLSDYVSFADYQPLIAALRSEQLAITPLELHGLFTGMLCGGLDQQDKSWQPLLFDYTNEGMGWPNSALKQAEWMLTSIVDDIRRRELVFSLALVDLIDIQADIFLQAEEVSNWINHFISGLGLMSGGLGKMPADVKEALSDLEEMAKLGIDENDDLVEQAQLLEQVAEHVKVCVLIIHATFGVSSPLSLKPTLH